MLLLLVGRVRVLLMVTGHEVEGSKVKCMLQVRGRQFTCGENNVEEIRHEDTRKRNGTHEAEVRWARLGN